MSDQFKQTVVAMAKGGQRQEALQYAKQYIHEHPDEVDAWWFVANLVKNPKVQRQCCEHILDVNPFHGEAQAMLDELNAAEQSQSQPKVSPFTVPAESSPFTQEPAPGQEAYTDPLGVRDKGQSTANPVGLPSVDEFFEDDDSARADNPFAGKSAISPDLRPLSMKMQAEMGKPLPGKSSPKSTLDDNTAFALVGVIGVVAVLIIVGAVYFIWQGKSEEESTLNLTQSETNELFTMQYPETWAMTEYENNRMVTTNRVLVNTTDVDPWGKFSEGLNALYPSEAFWDFAKTVDDKAAGEELFIAIMQPIPQPADYIIDNMISETETYYEGDVFLYSIKLDANESSVTVDNINAEFTALDAKLSLLGSTTRMEFYFVYLVNDGQHYLFTAMVSTPESDNWEAVARDIAESIRFGSPEESAP